MLPLDISTSEYQALADFRYQIRTFLGFSEKAAREAGVEPQQHQLMLAVRAAAKPATIGYLADRLQLRHHSTVGLVDRMETAGLVKRRRSESDRRSAEVRLTPRGSKVLGDLSVQHRSEMRSALPALIQSLTSIQHKQDHVQD
jgi:DNA-binding MarR family transcriptional regulator